MDTVASAPWGAPYTTITWRNGVTDAEIFRDKTNTYDFNSVTNTIAGCSGLTGGDLVIPTTVESPSGKIYNVENIGDSCFRYKRFMSITIPDSVKTIGTYAFSSCYANSITLGNGLETIGDNAFSYNNQTEITIGENVKTIGYYAFGYYNYLEKVTINGSGNLSISSSTFYSSTIDTYRSLKNIYIEDREINSIQYSPWGAYYADILWANGQTTPAQRFQEGDWIYTNLNKMLYKYIGSDTEIEIPSTIEHDGQTYPVTGLYSSCFSINKTITKVTFAPYSQIQSIGTSAFSGCSNLQTIDFPSKIKTIGTNAFSNCTSLTNLILPSELTSLGNNAFSGCTSITDVVMPDKVTSYSSKVFQDCSNLRRIVFGSGVKAVSSNFLNGAGSASSGMLNAYIYQTQEDCPVGVKGTAPWGASSPGGYKDILHKYVP